MAANPNDRFVDTSGWAELADPVLPFHTLAVADVTRAMAASGRLVTTNYVLSELTALLTRPLRVSKLQQIAQLRRMRADKQIEIVHIDAALDAAAWSLWENRPDKEWSLVDCASFVVMQQRRLTDALTTDHHFEQAGFVRLLR